MLLFAAVSGCERPTIAPIQEAPAVEVGSSYEPIYQDLRTREAARPGPDSGKLREPYGDESYGRKDDSSGGAIGFGSNNNVHTESWGRNGSASSSRSADTGSVGSYRRW